MSTYAERVLARCVETPEGCWEFQGAKHTQGYGKAWNGTDSDYTHRMVYRYLVCPIPDGLHIDHLCKNRPCCNPYHLDVVTREVNVSRGDHSTQGNWRAARERSKTHCPLGHPYDADNTYVTPQGHRQCRKCKAEAKRRYEQRQRTDAA